MLKNTVRTWRESSRMSKAHLARQIGVCRSYITRLEAGILQPSGDVMFRVAAYFRVPVEKIFERVEVSKGGHIFFGTKSLPNGNIGKDKFQSHPGRGQAGVAVGGRSARPSSGKGENDGQIAGRSGGGGRGVTHRVGKPKEMK